MNITKEHSSWKRFTCDRFPRLRNLSIRRLPHFPDNWSGSCFTTFPMQSTHQSYRSFLNSSLSNKQGRKKLKQMTPAILVSFLLFTLLLLLLLGLSNPI